MTMLEKLRQLFGSKLDEEVEESLDNDTGQEDGQDNKDKPAEPEKDKKDGTNSGEGSNKTSTSEKNNGSKDVVNDTVKEEVNDVAIFSDGWYDAATGKVDTSKIANEEVLNAIQTLQGAYENEKRQRMISDSINTELGNYSLGVSKDTLLKVLDTSSVKIDKDGKVVGVKEAIEALKTSEPGFFKDKEKESNPLNEGFNPVEKRNTDNINSFSEAFKLMEEIS